MKILSGAFAYLESNIIASNTNLMSMKDFFSSTKHEEKKNERMNFQKPLEYPFEKFNKIMLLSRPL